MAFLQCFSIRFAILTIACAAACTTAHAQFQSFGIGGILNPEGSRLFPQTFVFPRHPGKPDLRWKSFDWKFLNLRSKEAEYRLYYYEEEEWATRFTLPRIQNQIEYLTDLFDYAPEKKFDYLLFTSHREFQQANIFGISEGVQGVTSTTEATMAIPYWGETETFRHISTHEMVHQFQVQKINSIAKHYGLDVMQMIPLWFIEGMAEYYSQGGIDAESAMYLRDIVQHEDKEKNYTVPGFFEIGPMGFVHVYKLGQAKIHFLEKRFGDGVSQKLLEAASKRLAREAVTFADVASRILSLPVAKIEEQWKDYLKQYKTDVKAEEKEKAPAGWDAFTPVEEAGETLDLFNLSPSGKLLALRMIDPLTGVTKIRVLDIESKKDAIAAVDQKPDLLSLYFMQRPTMDLANDVIAYVVETTSGPELEFRWIKSKDGKPKFSKKQRLELHKTEVIQASSPAFSPDRKRIAFVGLNRQGWLNVYTVELEKGLDSMRRITDGYYAWKTLHWSENGLLGASDRTHSSNYGIFKINPDDGSIENVVNTGSDQLAPEGSLSNLYYQSWEPGSSQVFHRTGNEIRQLTGVDTGVMFPQVRSDQLYVLGFKSGRYRLFRASLEKLTSQSRKVRDASYEPTEPWKAHLKEIPKDAAFDYKPFVSSGTRLDNISGFFASGNVGGITATMSDLMRNYSVTGEFSVFGDFRNTSFNLFLASQKGRSTWVTGGYHIIQPKLDNIFSNDDFTRTYLYREFGALGAVQYPLGAFSYLDFGLRVGGVDRSAFSDPSLEEQWQRANPGVEFLTAPIVRFGYDRVLYELFTGPIKGFGVLLESDTSIFPGRESVTERLRIDLSYYIQAVKRTVIALQAVAAGSWGGQFRDPFFLSSDDYLRAYPFGDDRLLGNYLAAAKAEVRFPVGSLFGFPPLRGLFAYDFGTVFRHSSRAKTNFASSYTGGLGLNIPPIALNFMLSFPQNVAPGPVDSSVIHFTLRYLYL